MMKAEHLRQLHHAVESLRQRNDVVEVIQTLKEQLQHVEEPFVWASLDVNALRHALPEHIKSGWIFVLKPDVGSGCHYHPNSIQHMVMIEGAGKSQIAGVTKTMLPFGAPDAALDKIWRVISVGVPHEFFPEERPMVVVSFHTCEAGELEEVDCQSGKSRLYEG